MASPEKTTQSPLARSISEAMEGDYFSGAADDHLIDLAGSYAP